MLSFELSKEIEKDVFHLVTSTGQRKKILSPHKELNLRPSDSMLQCSTTEPIETTVSEVYYEVHMTHVLHTARVGNVSSIMFVNRLREKSGVKFLSAEV